MSAAASLILALVEDSRGNKPGGGTGGSSSTVSVADLRDALVRQSWRSVRLQARCEEKLRSLTSFVRVHDGVPESAALDLARTRAVFFSLLNHAVSRARAGGWVKWNLGYSSATRRLESTIQFCGEPVSEEEMRLLFPTEPKRNAQEGAREEDGTPPLPPASHTCFVARP